MIVEQFEDMEPGTKLRYIKTGEIFIFIKYDYDFSHRGVKCKYLNGNILWLNCDQLELAEEKEENQK